MDQPIADDKPSLETDPNEVVEPVKHAVYTHGDMRIISSGKERVEFRVDHFYCIAGSQVMRDVYQMRQDPNEPITLELEDTFENSVAVETFLDVLTGRQELDYEYS